MARPLLTCLVLLIVPVSLPMMVALADAPSPKVEPAKRQVDLGPAGIFGRLPEACTVQAVGTYAGTTDVKDVQLDRSGHRVKQADVVVNMPGRSIVLVLTAYDPTVWRVGLTPNTRVLGIVVSGYHGQALIGVEKRMPLEISSHDGRQGEFTPFYAYKASPQLLAMNNSVKRLVGREIDHIACKPQNGVFYVGKRPNDLGEVVYSDDLKVTDFVEKKPAPAPGQAPQIPAGQDGLDQLVKQGAIRPATEADIEAWVDKASEPYLRFNETLRVETYMRTRDTYVVLKEFSLPDGLHGAHSRHFIVPDGVPLPTGNKAHCTYYRMDGTAAGPAAER